MRLILLLLVPTLFACSRHIIVRSEWIDHSYLASCYVGTPDPRKCQPYCGEQLIIEWAFPAKYACYKDLHLVLTVHFRDLSEIEVGVPVHRLKGFYVYRLLNDEYCSRGGILTYKVDAFGGSRLIETWTHQMWVETIRLEQL